MLRVIEPGLCGMSQQSSGCFKCDGHGLHAFLGSSDLTSCVGVASDDGSIVVVSSDDGSGGAAGASVVASSSSAIDVC